MQEPTVTLLLSNPYVWLISVISIGAGAFLSSYLRKKGENLATHEDIQRLVDQVKATTEATKAIEARIDEQVWNTQRQWELKREALIAGGQAASNLLAAVMKVNAAYAIEKKPDDLMYGMQLNNHQTEAMQLLNKANYEFQHAQVLVAVVSSIETQTAFVAIEKILKTTGSRIVDGDTEAFNKAMPLVRTAATAITNAIRKELGIELVSAETTFLSTDS